MPRKSLRRQTIEGVIDIIKKLQLKAHIREIMGEEDVAEDYKLIHHKSILWKMLNTRYLYRTSKNRTDRKRFDLDDVLSYDSKNTNDDEFLHLFRVTRDSFFLFLDEMKDKEAFSTTNKCHQRPISYQLLVFLYRIGKDGSAGGPMDVAAYFGIGKGTVKNYTRFMV